MEYFPVVIIGAGLAGLNSARLLHSAGGNSGFLRLETGLGGRVLSANSKGEPAEREFDLGAYWFWLRTQSPIHDLVAELGLETFPQYSEGDVIFHRMSRELPRRFILAPDQHEPEELRLVWGNYALISAPASTFPASFIQCNSLLTRIELNNQVVITTLVKNDGSEFTSDPCHAAMPPCRHAAMPPCLIEWQWRQNS